MNAPLAHSPFGGSVAARVLRCPASVGLVAKVPEHLRKASVYAERGTALHTAMAWLIERERTLATVVGEAIGDYVVTRDDVENFLQLTLGYVDTLLDQPGEYFLERQVTFPGIENCFGTCDLIVRIGNTIHIVDFKFGAGVRVLALYLDGAEDVISAQLLFYAAGARHTLPEFFAGVETIVLTILQPVSIEPDAGMISTVAVTHAELDEFTTRYRKACEEALSPAPRLQKGAHCRFCPAKIICPLFTGPMLEFAQLEAAALQPPRAPADKAKYLQTLAHVLDLYDSVKELHREAHDQAKRALEAGDIVPRYALSAGRAVRDWKDTTAVVGDLMRLGLLRADIVEEVLRSPKQVELRAKARGLKVPQELIASSRSYVSLVREKNVRVPVLGWNEVARSFSEALAAFHERREAHV
jgi:hypothetical protein